MKAARCIGANQPLIVEELAEPALRPGSVLIAVEAAMVSPSSAGSLGRTGAFAAPRPPYTPGMDAIGRVVAVAPDVAGLAPGDRVYGDPFYRAANVSAPEDAAFIGGFGMGPGAVTLLEHWHDGAFAERVLLPAACVTPLGRAAGVDPGRLCRMGWIGTAYGGLVKAALLPGETVIVAGATGILGVSTVQLALAMGAARVIAIGRRADVLRQVAALDPGRVVAVAAETETGLAAALAREAAGADLLFDAVGGTDDATVLRTALGALRRGGRAVLTGVVGCDLPLAYGDLLIRELTVMGSLWFPREAARRLLDMIGTGALDLSPVTVQAFPLERANEALAAAAARPGGFVQVVVRPDGATGSSE
jgi:alcohol dehydrogenase